MCVSGRGWLKELSVPSQASWHACRGLLQLHARFRQAGYLCMSPLVPTPSLPDCNLYYQMAMR